MCQLTAGRRWQERFPFTFFKHQSPGEQDKSCHGVCEAGMCFVYVMEGCVKVEVFKSD